MGGSLPVEQGRRPNPRDRCGAAATGRGGRGTRAEEALRDTCEGGRGG